MIFKPIIHLRIPRAFKAAIPLLSDVFDGSSESPWYPEVEYWFTDIKRHEVESSVIVLIAVAAYL